MYRPPLVLLTSQLPTLIRFLQVPRSLSGEVTDDLQFADLFAKFRRHLQPSQQHLAHQFLLSSSRTSCLCLPPARSFCLFLLLFLLTPNIGMPGAKLRRQHHSRKSFPVLAYFLYLWANNTFVVSHVQLPIYLYWVSNRHPKFYMSKLEFLISP